MRIVFRCDGDLRVGAGHVARCLQIAAAFARAGHDPLFVGRYSGLAANIIAAEEFPACPPGGGPAGVPADAEAAVVDSYEIRPRELEQLAGSIPTASFCDHEEAPRVAAVMHYHLSPASCPRLHTQTSGLIGPDYAPVSPRLTVARRERGLERALVTVGGSKRARAMIEPAAQALKALGDIDVYVAGSGDSPDTGLAERIAWADVAVSAAGTTAYELVCAGVPTVVAALVDNQLPVALGMAQAGIARGFDARPGGMEKALVAQVAALKLPWERRRLAINGPATVDGYGAARARDALLAAFAKRSIPRVLRYRPARRADGEQLLEWRNETGVRAASRHQDVIDSVSHQEWLDRTLPDPDRLLLMVEHHGECIGSLRFDRRGAEAEISVSIANERRGGGIATQAIRETSELFLAAHAPIHRVVAEVRADNPASLRAFQSAGYRLRADDARDIRTLEVTWPVRSSPT